jgi:hypothetical protein
MEVVFRANDGEIFNDNIDCELHELELEYQKNVNDDLLFYSEKGNAYSPFNYDFEETQYIKASSELALDVLENYCNTLGFDMPIRKTGYYYYDNETNEWINLNEAIYGLTAKLQELKQAKMILDKKCY